MERLVDDKAKRDFLGRQLKEFRKGNPTQNIGEFTEFVLSVLADVVGRENVMSEVTDMGLFHNVDYVP